MFAFLRPLGPPRTNKTNQNPILYENGRASVQFHKPGSDYIMTHIIPPNTTEHGTSIIQPPFHLHLYQDEFFHVQSGTGKFYQGIASAPFTELTPESPKAMIKAGRYHRFENASATEDLVVDIHLTPESYENEMDFFRNFFGYLDDCKNAKVQPSVFQLMTFLYSADTMFALSLPWEAPALSRVFTWCMATWGSWILGYETSYKEYYEHGKCK